MSNEEFERKQTEQKAAHMLMVEFVKSNADLMATVLEPIVATWGEVTYPSLKDNMGVVSQVFAGVALELIDHNSSLDPEDCDNMVLPVGAKTTCFFFTLAQTYFRKVDLPVPALPVRKTD